jgi:hypothetical protein
MNLYRAVPNQTAGAGAWAIACSVAGVVTEHVCGGYQTQAEAHIAATGMTRIEADESACAAPAMQP